MKNISYFRKMLWIWITAIIFYYVQNKFYVYYKLHRLNTQMKKATLSFVIWQIYGISLCMLQTPPFYLQRKIKLGPPNFNNVTSMAWIVILIQWNKSLNVRNTGIQIFVKTSMKQRHSYYESSSSYTIIQYSRNISNKRHQV